MKAGETTILRVPTNINMSAVETVIFTLIGKRKFTKTYPTDVSYANGEFLIPLTQQNTIDLSGAYSIEGQVNYGNKSVLITDVIKGCIEPSSAVKIISGNTPSMDITTPTLTIGGTVIIVSNGGGGGGGEKNVQADWNQTNSTKDDFIRNKPSIPNINPVAKTEEMTQPVGIDADGMLYTGLGLSEEKVIALIQQYASVTLSSITATKTTTSYNVGDSLSIADIIVTAHYSNGSTLDVTSHSVINIDNVNMEVAGSGTINITYTENTIEKSTSFTITIIGIDEDVRYQVPQTGTWQLKNTTNKKYIMFGTDDDNMGNPKFFRLLRTYGFKYVMNTAAEGLTNSLGNDIDNNIFTSDDAPSLFPNSVTVTELGKYVHDSGLGEVAQHGTSIGALWDSSKLTGDFLTSLHASYTASGGTKTAEELKTAIMQQLKNTDSSQDASYVAEKRAEIEEALGFYIDTVGIWGGIPIATIDGITCDLNSIKGTDGYNFRAHNYSACGSYLSFTKNKNTFDMCRLGVTVSTVPSYLAQMTPGGACEFYWHQPFNDEKDVSVWRAMFSTIKSLVDNGIVEVVTRKEYADLGEYVENPVTKITVKRAHVKVGETDNPNAYITTATYADLTTADVSDEAIVDYSNVNTATEGSYTISVTYRGFYATTQVIVVNANFSIPDGLKFETSWFIAKNNTQGKIFAGNSNGLFGAAEKSSSVLKFTGCTGNKMNGWLSNDGGATWTQVNANNTHYGTISTNSTTGTTGFNFGNANNDIIVFLESSENFNITYTN